MYNTPVRCEACCVVQQGEEVDTGRALELMTTMLAVARREVRNVSFLSIDLFSRISVVTAKPFIRKGTTRELGETTVCSPGFSLLLVSQKHL